MKLSPSTLLSTVLLLVAVCGVAADEEDGTVGFFMAGGGDDDVDQDVVFSVPAPKITTITVAPTMPPFASTSGPGSSDFETILEASASSASSDCDIELPPAPTTTRPTKPSATNAVKTKTPARLPPQMNAASTIRSAAFVAFCAAATAAMRPLLF